MSWLNLFRKNSYLLGSQRRKDYTISRSKSLNGIETGKKLAEIVQIAGFIACNFDNSRSSSKPIIYFYFSKCLLV